MEFTLYEVVYLITYVVTTYSIYKIMGAFIGKRVTKMTVCIFTFAAYYVFIVGLNTVFSIPLLNMILNLIFYFALSFNFEGRLGKRLLLVVITFLIVFCCDVIGAFLPGYVYESISSENHFDSVVGATCSALMGLLSAIAVSRFKSTRKNISIPLTYWLVLLTIPIASVTILLIVLPNTNISQAEILISVVLMFLINFFVFYLYEKISEFVEDEQKKQVLLEQNKHYEKQIELMDTTLKATQSIRHDIKNHIGVIYGSLSNGDTKTAMEHISSMMTVYKYKNTFITGNAAIDSVLNFKIEEAKQNGITLEAYTELPENVGLDSFDSSVILGNLLDNAFEAVSALPDNRTVKCGVRYRCGLMVIEVSNPFMGKRIKEGTNYLTTKLDKKYHGIGLSNVRDIAKKYNGVLDLSEKDNVFKAAVTMYI